MLRLRRWSIATMAAVAVCASSLLASPAEASSWKTLNGGCSYGGVDGWSTYLMCYTRKKRVNDHTPRKDVYSFDMTLSGSATNGKYLAKLWVEPYPSGSSAPQSWDGAQPYKPIASTETTGSCKGWSWTIGVEAGLQASYSESGQVCNSEAYDPKMYKNDPGHWAAIWSASGSCLPSGRVRYVAAAVDVHVRQGGAAHWATDHDGARAYSDQGSC